MQAGIDMGLIQEAMQRRAMGEGGTPATAQMTMPGAPMPNGQPNTPTAPPAPPVSDLGGNSQLPPRNNVNAALKVGQAANSPQFDDETRVVAKNLVSKLLKVL